MTKRYSKKKIFIGCLPPNTDKDELELYLLNFCKISKFKVRFRSNNKCAGFGSFYCRGGPKLWNLLKTPHFHKGRSIEMLPFFNKKEREIYHKEFNKRRLLVGNLPQGITDLELFLFFSCFVPISRAYVVQDEVDKSGSPFGFVVVMDLSLLPILYMRNYILKGNVLVIKEALPGRKIKNFVSKKDCTINSETRENEAKKPRTKLNKSSSAFRIGDLEDQKKIEKELLKQKESILEVLTNLKVTHEKDSHTLENLKFNLNEQK